MAGMTRSASVTTGRSLAFVFLKIAVCLANMLVLQAGFLKSQALGQDSDQPPKASASELDTLVAPIALYPDPLLAQVLAASSFPDQIPGAYKWAMDHKGISSDALSNAMQKGELPYDPSVQALIPFPTVLEMMNKDIDWTAQLGN